MKMLSELLSNLTAHPFVLTSIASETKLGEIKIIVKLCDGNKITDVFCTFFTQSYINIERVNEMYSHIKAIMLKKIEDPYYLIESHYV